MKHILLIALGMACMHTGIGQEKTGRFQTDKNYKKYISPLSGYKYNAISVGISEIFTSKSLEFHYQRRITPRIWAEAGFMLGIGTMSPSFTNSYIAYFGQAYKITNLKIEFNNPSYQGEYIPENGVRFGNGYRFGLYRSIIGIAPFNTVSYGIQYTTRKMDVFHEGTNFGQGGNVLNSSKVNSNSIFATLMYKSNVVGPVGFDVCLGAGPSFLNVSGGEPVSVKKANSVTLDFTLQIRLFFAFLKI